MSMNVDKRGGSQNIFDSRRNLSFGDEITVAGDGSLAR